MKPGFFNDNSFRSFPFIDDRVGLVGYSPDTIEGFPNSAIVDFGCFLGCVSAYDTAQHSVFLKQVFRIGDVIYFDFRTDAPGLATYRLVFPRLLTDGPYSTNYVWVAQEDLTPVESEDPCFDPGLWWGYLTTGDLTSLFNALADGDEVVAVDGYARIEPSLVTNLSDAFVHSIKIANKLRTRSATPTGCPELEWPDSPPSSTVLQEGCLFSDVFFKAGYNATVQVEAETNTIVLGAGVKAGEGEPCSEVAIYEEEAAPDGRTLLDGGHKCGEAVLTINGVGNKAFQIRGGPSVVTGVPVDANTLTIELTTLGIAGCEE